MRRSDLVESVETDSRLHRTARDAALIVLHALYDGAVPEMEVETGPGQTYALYDMARLGLPAAFRPASLCLLIGRRVATHIGVSGGVWKLREPIAGRYSRALALDCVRDDKIDTGSVHRAVSSVDVLRTLQHELLHVLDAERTGGKMLDRPSDARDPAKYFNDPAEFNAFYHGLAEPLLDFIAELRDAPSSVADLLDLYGLTGDVRHDMHRLLNLGVEQKRFVAALTPSRRKSLLRRLYLLHRSAMAQAQAAAASQPVAEAIRRLRPIASI